MAESFSPGETNRVKQVLQSWLLADGWKLSDGSAADFAWVLFLEDANGRRLVLSQPKHPDDQVRIGSSVTIQGDQKTRFEALPADVRQRAWWRLRFMLLAMNVSFSGLGEPMQRIEVNLRIYFDGLTKDSFLRQVLVIRNALLAVMWTFTRELELADSTAPATTPEPNTM
jgi:hypothetical protein